MGQTADRVTRPDSEALSLASLACGVAALGWLPVLASDPDPLAIPYVCTGIALVGVSAGGVRLLRAVRRRWTRERAGILGRVGSAALAVVVVLGAVLACVALIPPYIGWFGCYALPPGNALGCLLSVAAVGLGIGSIARRERALLTAVPGIGLGMLVFAVSYAWDPIADTPSRAVRRFAAVAVRADQAAMISQLSAESVRHLNDLPLTRYGVHGRTAELVTVDHMHPAAARNTILLSVQREGKRATVECLIPFRRSFGPLAGYSGHGGHIHLVREAGAWKIDAYRHWQETRKRLEEAPAARVKSQGDTASALPSRQ